MGKFGEQAVVVLVAIVGVALVAVLVSNNSQTSSLIKSVGDAFTSSLGAALKPVTGVGSLG